jgi:Pyridoxamine 5'-phosphate oxidase
MQRVLQSKILEILANCHDMTVATVRPDGAPQATVVSFVHDGMLIYFGCGATSQKAANIAHDPRVSVAMTMPYAGWNEIAGLSLAAQAEEVTGANELNLFLGLIDDRFPEASQIEVPPNVAMKVFRLRPSVISVLDYAKGFGHTDLVTVEAEAIAETLDSMRHHWLVPTRPQ